MISIVNTFSIYEFNFSQYLISSYFTLLYKFQESVNSRYNKIDTRTTDYY